MPPPSAPSSIRRRVTKATRKPKTYRRRTTTSTRTARTSRKPTKPSRKQKKPILISNTSSSASRYHTAHISSYHTYPPIRRPRTTTTLHSMKLFLSQSSLAYATQLLNSSKTQEHGGAASVVGQNGELFLQEAQNNSKGADYIEIPPSTIMWHTHPQMCSSKANCSLGMPSSSDVERFIIDAMKHTCYAHMVFAHEGTYVIALKRAVRRDLARKSEQQQAVYAKNVAGEFANLQKQFQDNFDRVSYDSFSRHWMQFANRHSIDVMFFGRGVIPQFTVRP